MSKNRKILPGTGRGTMRSMVEGRATAFRNLGYRGSAARPSTPPLRVAVPLPLQGRI
jgi:hypothetical protein